MTRQVKTPGSALSQTKKPITTADGLENVIAGLGTGRDKRSYTNYTLPTVLDPFTLSNMYRASWLAKRVVNAVADDMTREWRTVNLSDDKDGDAFKQISKLEKKLAIRAKINEALTWGRLYGGAVIVIGVKGSEFGNTLSTPLNIESLGKDCLQWLHVIDRHRISSTGQICRELGSPNFGLPEQYLIAESSVVVHHSRIIRFNGEKIPYFDWQRNGMWDDSVLQHVIDSIKDSDTTRASIATMLFESNVDVISGMGIGELLATKDGEAKLIKRFQLAGTMKSFNRMLILDSTETYDKKSNTFNGLADIWKQFIVDVSGAAEIPTSILYGQSATGLNATGDNDVRGYYDKISSRQETDLRPQLEYLDQILIRSALGYMLDDYEMDFNPLWQMSDKEIADIQKTNSERDKNYLDAGVIHEGVVANELQSKGVYLHLTDADVKLAEELAKEPQNEPLEGAERVPLYGTEGDEPKEPLDDDLEDEPDADPTDKTVSARQEDAEPPKGGKAKADKGKPKQ